MKTSPSLRHLIASNDAEDAETLLSAAEATALEPKDPLILSLLLGIAAWISSLFLVGFLVVVVISDWWFTPEEYGALIIGVTVLGGGILLRYCLPQSGVFIPQILLAVVMCGHLVTLVGAIMVLEPNDPLLTAAVIQTILSGLAVRIVPRPTYQVVTLLATVALWTLFSLEEQLPGVYHCLLLIQIVAFATIVVWQSRRNSFAYTLALSLGASIFFLDWMQSHLWQEPLQAPLWPANLMLALLIVAIAFRCIPPQRHLHPFTLSLIAALLIAAFISTPGLLFAVAMLALGYSQRDAIFTTLGLAALPTFFVLFYYSLQVNLLEKSAILLASGLCCLLIAWLAHRRVAPTPSLNMEPSR